ncbi:HD-GYP domain-containing protein [Allobranchiibius sp. GilTou73]|uniref:HD-GYP domain-containing protein n=1 Tax=Allobranchiibius sp. GilTou73 TaxID=2904523 RepID=UPI001F306FB8|nr:HD domain-containing protein [Allobranchiibius sp. GilTou73]UIJ34674.1 HD domain-containing protein [Allobranchiibius sp. GilTou73]
MRLRQPGVLRWRLRLVWVILAVVLVFAAFVRVVSTAAGGARIAGWDAAILATLTVAIAFGSALPVQIGRARAVAPLATAASVALALASSRPHQAPVSYSPSIVIVCAAIGYAAGIGLRRIWQSDTSRSVAVAVPVVTVSAMSLLYRWLPLWGGHTSAEMYSDWDSQRWKAVCVMTVAALLPILGELLMIGLLVSPVRTIGAFLAETLRDLGPIYGAALSTGVAMAIGLQSLSLWAVPLVVMPLVLARSALRRAYSVQRERRQTIAALSTMTDVAGYTRPGHSARVADLARRVGECMRLTEQELTLLEDAALLHDIGQVSLSAPIPGGATVEAAPLDQLSIALEGGSIVRRSGVLDDLAVIIEAQTIQYRQVRELGEDVPVAARIIKVCNAFDDLTSGNEIMEDSAFERLSLGLGYEYDPAVVTALKDLSGRQDDVRRILR